MAQCTPCESITDPTEAPLGTVACNNNSIPWRLCDLEYAMAAVVRSYAGGVSGSVKVKNEAELRAALLTDGETLIELSNNIKISAYLNIPLRKTIIFGDWMFTNCDGTARIDFYGECVAYRQQIFCNFEGGQIRGSFGRESVYPEWWGLSARTGYDQDFSDNAAELRDDIAINAALNSFTRFGDSIYKRGVRVSLAQSFYYVGRPIDMTNCGSALAGAGALKTTIVTTINWKPLTRKMGLDGVLGEEESDLHETQYGPWGNTPHCAVLWIGGDYTNGTQNTFRVEVTGLWLQCGNASQRNWGYNISGISSRGGVEENSIIDNVSISSASGAAIGFTGHRAVGSGGGYSIPTVGGLTIQNFDIGGACKRGTTGILTSYNTYSCEISKGTINFRLAKSLTSSFGVVSLPNAFPFFNSVTGATTDDRYAGQSQDYADYGMVLYGTVSARNIHFEGMVNGVYCEQGIGAPQTIVLSNLDFFSLMDRSRGAVWMGDGMSGMDLTTTPYIPFIDDGFGNDASIRSNLIPAGPNDWNGFGCGVLIDNQGIGNAKDCVTISGIKAHLTLFLLRDRSYGIHFRNWGTGQEQGMYNDPGSIAFYARGNVYARSRDRRTGGTGGGGYPYLANTNYVAGAQDPASDIFPASTANPAIIAANNSRQFFIGPIY